MKNKKYNVYTLEDGTKIKMEYNSLLDKSDLKLKNGEIATFSFSEGEYSTSKERYQKMIKEFWG